MNTSIKCIIVDDEPPAIRLLKKYVDKIAFLELVATTTNSLEALHIIEKEAIDLVFLDIQMPNLTGIQLSKIVNDKTKIIFTTAYPQFALESYELNAIDYLLKPIEFERFYKAVAKLNVLDKENKNTSTATEEFLFVKTDGKNNFEKIIISEILYIESLKNYVAIHTPNKQIITYNTLKYISDSLPKSNFIQIHKSFIVALKHIEKTSSITVQINGKEVPLGNTYKNSFFHRIGKSKL
ncbi:DNA-binding response regulator [Polaribacter reichenbachii]|uniref:Two-component system response regulator n=1 Tax=Polaribacter reichenbachii TaxID=996801 RepID=A0A1B8U1E6_9FLAO|nr:LytTR family DNA-binding domain-containing protein [Polaribacter reichenbachii]APZ47337.1 DNA-binding response regulator [Polaribacter reichenbachii]AUC17978.1 DNA-binding response regulator [Polaribacter reichenbachii]OBY65695.1 two-component system response regulator [Polaribacter reichenbachii]